MTEQSTARPIEEIRVIGAPMQRIGGLP
jgi:hypothetical protein